jgi:hypothetical protein
MGLVQRLFHVGYVGIAALFLIVGFALVVMAGAELWHALLPSDELDVRSRFDTLLESIGMLTIAVASLELGQTVIEEEVLREAHMSGPTRVRRFLSRFLIVVVVSLSIECLVSVFQFAHADPELLPHAAAIGAAAALLLLAWGAFVRLNRSAEELEPEGLHHAKSEDRKVE